MPGIEDRGGETENRVLFLNCRIFVHNGVSYELAAAMNIHSSIPFSIPAIRDTRSLHNFLYIRQPISLPCLLYSELSCSHPLTTLSMHAHEHAVNTTPLPSYAQNECKA